MVTICGDLPVEKSGPNGERHRDCDLHQRPIADHCDLSGLPRLGGCAGRSHFTTTASPGSLPGPFLVAKHGWIDAISGLMSDYFKQNTLLAVLLADEELRIIQHNINALTHYWADSPSASAPFVQPPLAPNRPLLKRSQSDFGFRSPGEGASRLFASFGQFIRRQTTVA